MRVRTPSGPCVVQALLLALASLALAMPARAADDDFKYRPGGARPDPAKPDPARPAAPADDEGWGNKPAAANPGDAAEPGWGNASPRIPIRSGAEVTYAPTTQPTAVVGRDVFDLRTGKQLATLDADYDGNMPRALSADGKFFAAGVKGLRDKQNKVVVWAADSGKTVFSTDVGGADELVDFVGFGGPNAAAPSRWLVTGARDGAPSLVEVWDLSTGKPVRSFGTERIDRKKADVSPDGRYLAVVGHNQIRIHDLRAGTVAATLRNPIIPDDRFAPAAAPVRPGIRRPPVRPANAADVVFVYAWTANARFSPSGKEFVGLFTHPHPRLIVWDNGGNVVLNEAVSGLPDRSYPHQDGVQASPDGQSFLLYGTALYDRKARKVVWRTKVPWASDVQAKFVEKDKLIIGTGANAQGEVLELAEMPAEQIRKALDAMANPKAPAFLRPGQAITLTVDVVNVRAGGDKEEARKKLTEAMTARLERDGFVLKPGQDTTVFVSYDEKAGEKARVVEKTSPFDRGRDTGREVEQSRGIVLVEVRVKGQKDPAWSTANQADPASSFREEITDQTVRASMFENMLRRIRELDMPYFLPVDPSIPALPLDDGEAQQR